MTSTVVRDVQNQPRQLLIRYTKGLGWFFVVEVRQQVGGRRPFAGGIEIDACGKSSGREGLIGYSALNAETVGIGAELSPREIEAISRCGQSRLRIGGIEVTLDSSVAMKIKAISFKAQQ